MHFVAIYTHLLIDIKAVHRNKDLIHFITPYFKSSFYAYKHTHPLFSMRRISFWFQVITHKAGYRLTTQKMSLFTYTSDYFRI